MQKKIRFPLEMADGVLVRTLDELKEHFNLEAMLEYYKNGKLLTWLQDRYLETEAEAVRALDESAENFTQKFCDIFGAECPDAAPLDLEVITLRQERLKRLRKITDEEIYIDHIDQVAFDQEELADLLDQKETPIYLCGERFMVPVSQKGISYIGINQPSVKLTGKIPQDAEMEDLNLHFEGCRIENPPEQKAKTIADFIERTYKELGISENEDISIRVQPQMEAGKTLKETDPTSTLVCGSKDELEIYIQGEVQSWAAVDGVTGLALTVVDDEFQKTLGRSGRTNKFQIALKFNPASAEAHVSAISMDFDKKGYRPIQLELDHPVFLDGVRYDHVPVLSVELYKKLGLRKHENRVRIHRVGDVIPSITVVDEGRGDKFGVPHICHNCLKRLVELNGKLYCGNPECTENAAGRFTGFFQGIGLDGYNESFAKMLVDKMRCYDIAKMLDLTKSDFKSAGIKTELAMKFPDALKEALKGIKDYQLLAAMGLPGIGPARAKVMVKIHPFAEYADNYHFGGNEYVMSKLFGGSLIKESDGIRVADAFRTFVDSFAFKREIKALTPYVVETKDFSKITTVGHTGGNLSEMVKKACSALGFDITDGKSFDILITKDMSSNSTKMEHARKKGIPIFEEDAFLLQYYPKAFEREDDDNEDEYEGLTDEEIAEEERFKKECEEKAKKLEKKFKRDHVLRRLGLKKSL